MDIFEERVIYNEILFRYAQGKSIRLGNEIHPVCEIVYFIDGDATFLSADYKERLSKGTLLIIPKETFHNFDIKGESYRRLTIWFPASPIYDDILLNIASQLRLIKNPNNNIVHLLTRMCNVMRNQNSTYTNIFLYGSLLSLLSEISFNIDMAIPPTPRNKETLIARCIEYIDKNYTSPISVEDIAKELYVSTSTIFQHFKNELGISLHRYITEKRMILAKKLIAKGENPTDIFTECGFTDYSAFYKAYRKMFNVSPSADKKQRSPNPKNITKSKMAIHI